MSGTANNNSRPTNPWAVLAVLCVGFFLIMLDTTIVNVALPQLALSLHSSLDHVVWVVNAYLLTYSVLLIPSGRLGDIWGPRNLFTAGVALFTLASAACGLSQTSDELIAMRLIQGAAAALLTPQALTMITTALSPAAGWISFMLPMIVTGAGVGLANAPLTSEAMRSVAPQETGAASGVLNSARQFGGLLGVTIVGGAALQSHLQSALNHRAQSTATSLNAPPSVRAQFVHAFSGVDRTGLLITPGQNGGVRLPTGLSAHTTEVLQQAAQEVFTRSLVDAAGPTMLIPIVVVAVGAISSLFADNPGRSAAPGLTKQLVGDGAVL